MVRLNSINIRKRILEGSKVGAGRGLFLVVFEPDFDETDVTWGEAGEWTCRLYTGVGTLVLDMTHRWEC